MDIGIGGGYLAILIKKIYKYTVEGLDRNKWQKKRFDKFGIKLTDHDLSNGELPYENESFMTILLCEVIEHLDFNPYILLEEIHRLLKPSGYLIITTPNITSLDKRIKMLFGRSPLQPFDYSRYISKNGQPHVREYTVVELCKIITDIGFNLTPNAIKQLKNQRYGEFAFKKRSYNPIRYFYDLSITFNKNLRPEILIAAQKIV